jgi:hypothetical protein
MTPDQQWQSNMRFLDRAIDRGDRIVLATHVEDVRPGSFLEREIQYLQTNGYAVSKDGHQLLPAR